MDDWNDTIDDIASSQSQSQSQSTQPASQPEPIQETFENAWGVLDSSDPSIPKYVCYKSKRSYTLGRRPNSDVVLDRRLVSGLHCIIGWDGRDAVTISDKSMNGTFINGRKLPRGGFGALKHGDQISLGSAAPSDDAFRFKYRHTIPLTPLQLKYDPVMCPRLGQGSFGEVWKWVSKATGEPVAVKYIRDPIIIGSPSNNDVSARREQCIREADILQRFDHQNICKLKDVFLEDDPFSNQIILRLVLEFIPGGDLCSYLARNRALSEVDTKHFIYQICKALECIHSQGVAHRDLKPENILLTEHRPPKVKVADFGLAKFLDNNTYFTTMCGSPAYIAPEVATGNYDERVDDWAVGVMTFLMLSEYSPFVDPPDATNILSRISNRQIDFQPLRRRDPTDEAVHFIKCLLKPEPKQRMTSTGALEHEWFHGYMPVYDD